MTEAASPLHYPFFTEKNATTILTMAEEIFYYFRSTLIEPWGLEAKIEREGENSLTWRIKADNISLPFALHIQPPSTLRFHTKRRDTTGLERDISRLGQRRLRKLLRFLFVRSIEDAVIVTCYFILALRLLSGAMNSQVGRNFIWWKEEDIGEITCIFLIKGRSWKWIVTIREEEKRVFRTEIRPSKQQRNPVEAFKEILSRLSLHRL